MTSKISERNGKYSLFILCDLLHAFRQFDIDAMAERNVFRTDGIAAAAAYAHLETGALFEFQRLMEHFEAHPFARLLAEAKGHRQPGYSRRTYRTSVRDGVHRLYGLP